MKVYTENKQAYYDYEILEKLEAGVVLTGSEVKSIRSGKGSIKGSYVVLKDGEAFLVGAVIPPYQPLNAPKDYDPQRSRKLLLKKSELNYLLGKSQERGLTLIPLKFYAKYAMIKLEFAIAKGKKKRDKRETIKKREADREIERSLKEK